MSMNVYLYYEHPLGAKHEITRLYQTPTVATYEILGIDVEKDGFDAPVTDSYEVIRDRYLAWVNKRFKGCLRHSRTNLKREHEIWTKIGFTAKWDAH